VLRTEVYPSAQGSPRSRRAVGVTPAPQEGMKPAHSELKMSEAGAYVLLTHCALDVLPRPPHLLPRGDLVSVLLSHLA
jgi:hypothetical protein